MNGLHVWELVMRYCRTVSSQNYKLVIFHSLRDVAHIIIFPHFSPYIFSYNSGLPQSFCFIMYRLLPSVAENGVGKEDKHCQLVMLIAAHNLRNEADTDALMLNMGPPLHLNGL